MNVCTLRSDTKGEAKLADITQRKAIDVLRAPPTPPIQFPSVPAGAMKGRAFTSSSGAGSKRTSPPRS